MYARMICSARKSRIDERRDAKARKNCRWCFLTTGDFDKPLKMNYLSPHCVVCVVFIILSSKGQSCLRHISLKPLFHDIIFIV